MSSGQRHNLIDPVNLHEHSNQRHQQHPAQIKHHALQRRTAHVVVKDPNHGEVVWGLMLREVLIQIGLASRKIGLDRPARVQSGEKEPSKTRFNPGKNISSPLACSQPPC
jgi:hypothetical protein